MVRVKYFGIYLLALLLLVLMMSLSLLNVHAEDGLDPDENVTVTESGNIGAVQDGVLSLRELILENQPLKGGITPFKLTAKTVRQKFEAITNHNTRALNLDLNADTEPFDITDGQCGQSTDAVQNEKPVLDCMWTLASSNPSDTIVGDGHSVQWGDYGCRDVTATHSNNWDTFTKDVQVCLYADSVDGSDGAESSGGDGGTIAGLPPSLVWTGVAVGGILLLIGIILLIAFILRRRKKGEED